MTVTNKYEAMKSSRTSGKLHITYSTLCYFRARPTFCARVFRANSVD